MIGLKPPSECNPEADDNSDNEYHQSYSINIEEAKTGTSIGFFSCLIFYSLSLSLSPLFLLPILFYLQLQPTRLPFLLLSSCL